MSIEQIINFLKWMFSGDGKEGVEPFLRNPHALLLVFVFALLLWTGDLIRRGSMRVASATFLLAAILGGSFYALQTGVVPVAQPPQPQRRAEAPPPEQPVGKTPPVAPMPPTGMPAPAQVAIFDMREGYTLIGRDLGSAVALRDQRLSLDACKLQCSDRFDCAAFTFDTSEQSCMLKGAVGEEKPFDHVVSGIKRSPTAQARP